METAIGLNGSMRSNLLALQGTTELLGRTQERLSTGKRVNSALDNPSAFFASSAHQQRADMLSARKEAIGEAVQTIKKSNEGVSAIKNILEAARGIVSSARTNIGDATKMGELQTQYNDLLAQLDNIVTDSSYKGINLLDSSDLDVAFNEDNTTNITLTGFDAKKGGAVVTADDVTWDGATLGTDLDTIETTLNTSLENLNVKTSELASNLSVLKIRETFITNSVNTLEEGANKLTAADMNEEAANMLTLQTRQQLSMTALSMANQAAQSIMRLF